MTAPAHASIQSSARTVRSGSPTAMARSAKNIGPRARSAVTIGCSGTSAGVCSRAVSPRR